jgi:hypothetical protein
MVQLIVRIPDEHIQPIRAPGNGARGIADDPAERFPRMPPRGKVVPLVKEIAV